MTRPRLALATLLTVLAAALAGAAPSSAATNPYTPVGLCGGAYHVIDQHAIRGPKGGLIAQVYLLWSGRTGKNCVVTIKRRAVGSPSYVSAKIYVQGGGAAFDDKLDYTYYAGPIYVPARGKCVVWGGGATDALHQGNGENWISPRPEHCGGK